MAVNIERQTGWADLYLREDWWAIWLGLGILAIAVMLFREGSFILLKSLTINPGGLKWTTFAQLSGHLTQNCKYPHP